MRHLMLLATAAIALTACNQNSVTLHNASPEEVKAAADAAGVHFNPGQWETTIEITEAEIPGMPKAAADVMKRSAMRTQKHSYCMTKEESEKPGSGLLTGDSKSKCNVEKFSMSGGHIEQVISCPDSNGTEGMRMSTTGDYTADSMTGTASMEMGAGQMKMKANLSSRRVGECKPGEK